MADTRLGILIEENFDEADAKWKKHERVVTESVGRMGTAHENAAKNATKAYDQYKAGALSSIKTIAEYHLEWDKKTTTQLIGHIKELQDKKVDEQLFLKKSLAEGDAIQTRIHKNRIEQITLESRALKQLSIERPLVKEGGAGSIIGQLGLGRNITNMAAMFPESKVGFGGPAMIQENAFKGPTEGLTRFAGLAAAAVAAGGGLYGLVKFGKDFGKAGLESMHVLDQLHDSYATFIDSEAQVNREYERSNKLATDLSSRWIVSSDTVRKLAAEQASLGHTTGQTNSDIVKASLAMQLYTKDFGEGAVSASQFMRIFNYGINDPEAQVALGRLKLRMGDLGHAIEGAKNTQDALNIVMKYSQGIYKQLDADATDNQYAVDRAAVAWAELKRSIGLTLAEGATPALSVLSKLSDLVSANAQLLGPVAVALGISTVALGAWIVALKIARDEEVKHVAGLVAGKVAHLVHADAVNVDTGAIVGWGVAVKGTVLPVAGGVLAVTGLAYAFVKMHDAKIEAETAKVHAFNVELTKGRSDAVQAAAALDRLAQSHVHDNAELELARKRQEQVTNTTVGYGYQLRSLNTDIKAVTTSSDDFTTALKKQNAELVTNAKDRADNAIAAVEFFDKRLKDPSVTGHKREVFEQLRGQWKSYGEAAVKAYESEEKAHNKASISIGASTPEGPTKEDKNAKAFTKETDAIRDALSKRIAEYQRAGHTVEEIEARTQELTLEADRKILASAEHYAQRVGELELKVENDKLQIQKRRENEAKKEKEESDKQTKQDAELAMDAYAQNLERRRAMLQEDEARGKDIKRAELLLEIEAATNKLQVAQHQNEGVADAKKHLNDLREKLRLDDLKDATEQGKRRIQVEHEVQDRLAELISNPEEREKRKAELKRAREQEAISEITDTKVRQELTLASEKEYEAALLAIKQKAKDDTVKTTADIIRSGLSPMNAELHKAIENWKLFGGTVKSVVESLLSKALDVIENKGLESILGGIVGGNKSAGASSSDSGKTDPGKIFAGLSSLIPKFGDSNGPVGNANGPMVGGKALVLADPMDWLIKIPSGGESTNNGPSLLASWHKADTGIVKKDELPGLGGKRDATTTRTVETADAKLEAAKIAREKAIEAQKEYWNKRHEQAAAQLAKANVNMEAISGIMARAPEDRISLLGNSEETKSAMERAGVTPEYIKEQLSKRLDEQIKELSPEHGSTAGKIGNLAATTAMPIAYPTIKAGIEETQLSQKQLALNSTASGLAAYGSVYGDNVDSQLDRAYEGNEDIKHEQKHVAIEGGSEALLGLAFKSPIADEVVGDGVHFLEHKYSHIVNKSLERLAEKGTEVAPGIEKGVETVGKWLEQHLHGVVHHGAEHAVAAVGIPHAPAPTAEPDIHGISAGGAEPQLAELHESNENEANVASGLAETFSTLKEASSTAASALGSQLVGAVGGASGMLNGLVGSIGGAGGGGIGGILQMALPLLGIPGFASGTDFAPGGAAFVGERGPELLHIPRGSRVIPNHKLGFPGGSGSGMDTEAVVKAIQGIPRSTVAVDQDNFRVSQNRSRNLERNRAFA